MTLFLSLLFIFLLFMSWDSHYLLYLLLSLFGRVAYVPTQIHTLLKYLLKFIILRIFSCLLAASLLWAQLTSWWAFSITHHVNSCLYIIFREHFQNVNDIIARKKYFSPPSRNKQYTYIYLTQSSALWTQYFNFLWSHTLHEA